MDMNIKVVTLISLLLILSNLSISQNSEIQDKYPKVFIQIDSIIRAYVKASSFKSEYSEELTDKEIDKFKDLFLPDALIADELCPRWFDGTTEVYNYQWLERVNRPLNDYCQKRKDKFKGGMENVNILNRSISLVNLQYGTVLVLLEKETKAIFTEKDLLITSKPRLEVELKFSEDFEDVKIAAIRFSDMDNNVEGMRYSPPAGGIPFYELLDDSDFDFVKDKPDLSPTLPGLTANSEGAPSSAEIASLRKMGFNFEPSLSFDLTLFPGFYSVSPKMAGNPIDNYLDSQSWGDNITLNPEVSMRSYGIQFMTNYFFGTSQKTWGFGVGIQYQYFTGNFTNGAFKVSFKDSISSGAEIVTYRRTVSTASIEETFTANSLSIPMLLKWKKSVSNKLVLEIGLGVNLDLAFSGKSDAKNVNLNYEGTFTRIGSQMTYQSDSTLIGSNLFEINANNSASFQDYLGNEGGLNSDFGNSVVPDSEKSLLDFNYSGSLALMGRANVIYKFKPNTSLFIGLSYLNGMFSINDIDASRNYILSNELGNYNTLGNSFEKLDYQSFFVNLGVRYSLSK